MKINYILSDTTKNATSVALSRVIKRAEQNVFGDFIVIVPETKSIIIEKELLSLSKSKAFANIYVYSFVRLLKRLGFVPEEKIVTKPACVLLLRKIILSNLNKLECYKKTAKTVGFAEKMYETIAQLKSSGIGCDDLKNLEKLQSSSLKAKLKDIAFVYEEYEKALGDGLYDDLDKLALLSNFAKTSDVIKQAEIFVVGFDNITFEMGEVLKNLAKNAKEITFSSVYFNDKRADKHIQSNDLFNRFKHIADELNVPYNPEFVKARHGGDFYAIANFLNSTEKHKTVSNGAVQIFEAKTKKRELDYVANTILKEVKAGKRFKDIGVFVCDLNSTSKLIEKCFESYKIPYFINEEYDVSSHIYVKFLMNSLELVSSNLASNKVLEFLSSPFSEIQNFSELFNFVNEFGINYKSFLEIPDDNLFENAKTKEIVTTELQKFQDFFGLLSQKVKNAKFFADYVQVVDFVAKYFKAKEKLIDISNSQNQAGFKCDAQITLQMFDKVQKFCDLSNNFLGTTEVSLDEFILLFRSGFSAVRANVAPVSIDCVVVQNNTDGFFDICDLFVVGAEEGKFPAKIQDTGVILDKEIEETKLILKNAVEPTVKEINKRENFRVYEALLEPKEKLFVSYSLKDIGGTAAKPARAVLDLVALFGEEILEKNYTSVGFVSAKNEELRFARNINKFINGQGITEAELNKQYSQILSGLSKPFKDYLENKKMSEKEFFVNDATDIYFKNNKTSISQLEKYFACPYLFFVEYGLRLKENKKAKISSMDIGNLLHRVAELFVMRLKSFENLLDDDFDKKLITLFEEVVDEQKVKTKQNKAVVALVLGEVKRLCKYILFEQQNSSFKVQSTEFNFKADKAVKLVLDDGREIAIEGKIDRIDKFGDYLRIIDYKTGDIKSELKSVFVGEKIQLISYLSALTSDDKTKVAGVFYLPIHSEYEKDEKKLQSKYKMEGFILSDADVVKNMDHSLSFENPESKLVPIKLKSNKTLVNENRFEMYASQKALSNDEFEALKSYTEKLCKTAVSEILEGYNEPSPLERGGDGLARCKYCNYAGFCGIEKSKHKYGRMLGAKISKENFNKNEG